MMYKQILESSLLLVALATTGSADPDLDSMVGEWSISTAEESGDCAEMRMVFDFEGNYALRVADDGRWQALTSGRWSRDGEQIVTVTGDQQDRLVFEMDTYERVVLVSRDGPVDRELGVGYLDLGRCPAY